jgi:hypothetical protein
MLELIKIKGKLPYFAEIPYWMWGEVNYNSEGDCKNPTSRDWNFLEVTNRVSRERIMIQKDSGSIFRIETSSPESAKKIFALLKYRSDAQSDNLDKDNIDDFILENKKQVERIIREFPDPRLRLFDHHGFWGSWKWVGWFATEFTWVGRWIMNSVLTNDTRGIFLCYTLMKEYVVTKAQEDALIYAINYLSGNNFKDKNEVFDWYEGKSSEPGKSGVIMYPEPDYNSWLEDLKKQNLEWQ